MVQGSLFLLFLCLPLLAFAGTSAKLRVNEKGVNYVAGVAREILEKEIRAMHIPNQEFRDGSTRVKAMNIQLFSVELPKVNVTIENNNDLVLRTSNGAVNGRFRFQAIYYILFAKITVSGNADMRLWNLNSHVVLRWKKDSPKPQLEVASCDGRLETFRITLHGNILVNIANWFKGEIGRSLRDSLSKNICPQTHNAVEKLNKALAEMPDLYPVTKEGKRIFSIKTENLKTAVGPDFFDVTGNAVFIFKNKKCTAVIEEEFPESPAKNMASAWGSQGIPDCLLHAFHESDQLQYHLNNKTSDVASFLRTSCSSASFIPNCMGNLFPKLADDYPNRTVEILAFSTAPPNVTIDKDGVRILGYVGLNVTIDSKDLARFDLNLTTIFIPVLKPDRLNGTIRAEKMSISLTSSNIGPMKNLIPMKIVEKLVAAKANLLLKPYADKGIPIPLYMGITIANSSLVSLEDGYMRTDVDLYHS